MCKLCTYCGYIDCGMYSVKIYKNFNFPILLSVILEYSHRKEVEEVLIIDLQEKLKELPIRRIEIWDYDIINTILGNVDAVFERLKFE